VVYIHGAGYDHSVWLPFMPWLSQHDHAVLAIDLPGHGLSKSPPLASIEAMAQWLLALLDATQVQEAALVGHSMGSLVALELAASHPERVTHLALLGTAAPMAVSDELLTAARHDEARAQAMIHTWSQGNRRDTPPPPAMSAAPGVLYADLVACDAYMHAQAAAAKVGCPALLMIGAADKMTSPRNAQRFASHFKDARCVTLPDCGHAMLTECPEALLAALRNFIAPDQ